jgi:hypothetical protein
MFLTLEVIRLRLECTTVPQAQPRRQEHLPHVARKMRAHSASVSLASSGINAVRFCLFTYLCLRILEEADEPLTPATQSAG